MIKSVVVPWTMDDRARFEAICASLVSLGFETGEGWDDHRSTGRPFVAPIGAIEIVHGTAPANAELIVEVEDLSSVVARAEAAQLPIERQPYISHWSSEVCIVRLPGDTRIAFFRFLKDGELASDAP
jgi:hypothetical protein